MKLDASLSKEKSDSVPTLMKIMINVANIICKKDESC